MRLSAALEEGDCEPNHEDSRTLTLLERHGKHAEIPSSLWTLETGFCREGGRKVYEGGAEPR
jgi:hypothetical protein